MADTERLAMTTGQKAAIAPASNELAQVGTMIQSAVDKGIDAEGIKALAETYKDFADRDAKQQFNRAFATFKDACPQPRKTKASHHGNYTPIDELERVCGPHLRANGFSWSWDAEPAEGGMLHTTFVLEHEGGHSKRSNFTLPISTRAGMGEQEKYASAYSWGRRITFMSGLGLTDTDEDTVPLSRISEAQVADFEAKIEEVPKHRRAVLRSKFLKLARTDKIEEILLEQVDELTAALEDAVRSVNEAEAARQR